MRLWLANVRFLAAKELRSLMKDTVLVFLILFAFTVAIGLVAEGVKAEVSNATVGVIDNDRSDLSLRLRDAIRPPYFKPPIDLPRDRVEREMDAGRTIFVIEFPPRFQADVLAGRSPDVQLLVDATAMTQAGLGASYMQQIFAGETLEFLHARGLLGAVPVCRAISGSIPMPLRHGTLPSCRSSPT
jgi:ABC-2 type transport system permease protein